MGYPEGLKGEDIPLIAAVIAVADAYDAMTTDRPYRKALPKEAAIEEIRRFSSVWFNPNVTTAMIALYEQGEI